MPLNNRVTRRIEKLGDSLVSGFHLLALFVIGGTIVWSAGYEYYIMLHQGRATLQDILILFIYLELGAMVGIYFKTYRLPVRFLLYVGITALTRSLVVDIEAERVTTLLIVTGAILMLAVAIVVLGYGGSKFDSDEINLRDDKKIELD